MSSLRFIFVAVAFAFFARTMRYVSGNFSTGTCVQTASISLFFSYHFVIVNAVYNQIKKENMQGKQTIKQAPEVPEGFKVTIY